MTAPPRRRTLIAAVATLLLAPLGVAASATTAAETTTCTDQLSHTSSVGHVRVPPGAHCTISDAAVGDLVAERNAVVAVRRSTVKGDVRLARNAHLRLEASTVWRGVDVDGASGVTLLDVTVLGSIRGTTDGIHVDRSRILGAINAGAPAGGFGPRYRLNDSLVGGWVNLLDGYVAFQDVDMGRGLTVRSPSGVEMCDTTVAGDAVIAAARWIVDLGSQVCLRLSDSDRFEDGVPGTRRGNRIRGSLHLLDNERTVTVRRTMIAGDLVCTENRGRGIHTHHSTVRVGGTRSGQCA